MAYHGVGCVSKAATLSSSCPCHFQFYSLRPNHACVCETKSEHVFTSVTEYTHTREYTHVYLYI